MRMAHIIILAKIPDLFCSPALALTCTRQVFKNDAGGHADAVLAPSNDSVMFASCRSSSAAPTMR
jgi:hypothetical protein